MRKNTKLVSVERGHDLSDLPAGDFSAWLRHARQVLCVYEETVVACGECHACCSSSYFIHIRPEETQTLRRIPKALLAPAPGMPKGYKLLGYDQQGCCPMLKNGQCSIYVNRPRTCRNYDCRVFTAAGIDAGGEDKIGVTRQARRWKFSYPTQLDHDEHLAVQAAAAFIQSHADCFPEGAIPSQPGQLAILAIKVYEVFLKPLHASDRDIANAVVAACRAFDAKQRGQP